MAATVWKDSGRSSTVSGSIPYRSSIQAITFSSPRLSITPFVSRS
ncbi:hypothetical protein [Streptomyces sp. NBC_00820]